MLPHFNAKNNGRGIKGKRWKRTQVVDCWRNGGGGRAKACDRDIDADCYSQVWLPARKLERAAQSSSS